MSKNEGQELLQTKKIRDFRDLIIWRKSISLAKDIYRLTQNFPNGERFGLTAQIRRAAVSVSSNIAEGHMRRGREFAHFLSIARGSLAEMHSQLLVALELGYIKLADVSSIFDLVEDIRRMSAVLVKKLDAVAFP